MSKIEIVSHVYVPYLEVSSPISSLYIAVPSGSPTGVIVEALSSTSVLIKWSPPEILLRNGVITKYNLNIVFASNNTFQSYSVPPAILAFRIEGIYDT